MGRRHQRTQLRRHQINVLEKMRRLKWNVPPTKLKTFRYSLRIQHITTVFGTPRHGRRHSAYPPLIQQSRHNARDDTAVQAARQQQIDLVPTGAGYDQFILQSTK